MLRLEGARETLEHHYSSPKGHWNTLDVATEYPDCLCARGLALSRGGHVMPFPRASGRAGVGQTWGPAVTVKDKVKLSSREDPG